MNVDMTAGSPTKTIVTFAVPVLLSNILQQMYNTAAAIIAGRLIGEDALAAISVADPIISIAVFFMFGICVGVSVLLAQLYGAEDYEGFRVQTSTALIAGSVFTVLLSILCILISKPVLVISNTPDILINDADRYIKIIFGGLIFSFLYNFFSSALRAIGDSRTPFVFLLGSSVLNVCLCILFIKVFHMDVSSMAVATVISQAASSMACILYVYIKIPILSLKAKEFVFRTDVLVKTVKYSWASAIQQTFLYIGRFLVQGTINPLGPGTIAAYNTATRVEAFVIASFESVATSLSTYSAQNMGAGLSSRIRAGLKKSAAINIINCIMISSGLFAFSPKIMSIFVTTEGTAIIEVGSMYLKTTAMFYILASITSTFQGFFRGLGKLSVTMMATGLQILIRVVCSHMLVPAAGVKGIGYAVALGWVAMILFQSYHSGKYFKQVSDCARVNAA